MKKSSLLLSLISMLSFAMVAPAQNVTEKTLVKSFNLQGHQLVQLNLDGAVDVQTWKSDIMRIQINIGISDVHPAVLKSLIQAGRYNLRQKLDGDQFTIYAPGLDKEVRLRGTVLQESISYTVFAPEKVAVQVPEASTTANIGNPSF